MVSGETNSLDDFKFAVPLTVPFWTLLEFCTSCLHCCVHLSAATHDERVEKMDDCLNTWYKKRMQGCSLRLLASFPYSREGICDFLSTPWEEMAMQRQRIKSSSINHWLHQKKARKAFHDGLLCSRRVRLLMNGGQKNMQMTKCKWTW